MNERQVTVRQLLELQRRLAEDREDGDDKRITYDMVNRLTGFDLYGHEVDDGFSVFNQATVALLEAVKKCEKAGGLTRVRLQAFLRNPLAALSDVVVVKHTEVCSAARPWYIKADALRLLIRDLGIIDGLPQWFGTESAPISCDLGCNPGYVVVHRLCCGHTSIGNARAKILRVHKLVPAGINVLLSLAVVNTHKHPHIATGTLIQHQDELMTSAANYAPLIWYDPKGQCHIALQQLDGLVSSDSSFLAIDVE